jgi:hypothetical protein
VRFRFVICTLLVMAAAVACAGNAAAQDGAGQNPQTSAGATTGPGAVQVNVGQSGSGPAAAPSSDSAGPSSSGSSGASDPNAPYGCTYTVEPSSVQQLLGPGGSSPGQWELPYCQGPGVIDPLPPVWVPTAQPQQVAAPPVDPAVVGQQAVSELVMPTPTIEMAPPAGAPQLVNVAAWLWIDPGAWAALSATATTGPVTATATATPVRVVWDMGNGAQVTCDGPGTPYSPAYPTATTGCSYTWTQAGSFSVTATVYWQVSWTATGAPGGGNLGMQAGPAAQVTVEVTESQAINTPSGGSD